MSPQSTQLQNCSTERLRSNRKLTVIVQADYNMQTNKGTF